MSDQGCVMCDGRSGVCTSIPREVDERCQYGTFLGMLLAPAAVRGKLCADGLQKCVGKAPRHVAKPFKHARHGCVVRVGEIRVYTCQIVEAWTTDALPLRHLETVRGLTTGTRKLIAVAVNIVGGYFVGGLGWWLFQSGCFARARSIQTQMSHTVCNAQHH